LGECVEDIIIDSDIKEDMAIGLNAQFLYESIKEMDSETVNVGITGQMSPVKFIPDNDPDFISVIMPIKIKESE
jgi:DNA polymerase III sliding clamp (beta) subunit (PCNA family)